LSLWILAALNSTDRSVAPLDAALRRRFSILYVGPDYSVLANHLGISEPAEETPFAAASVDPATWGEADVKELAIRLLRAMNTRISFVLGQDFLLGHALLWSVNGSDVPALANSLVRSFDERIAATLRLTFVDQDEALAAILNVPIPTPGDGIPRVGRWMEAPPALQTVAPARLELQELAALSWPQAMRALVALLS
jgi:5-methylcytosine-specific restriction protein B